MILVYGGAFNPPTLAHYKIADLLIKKFNCNFIFVPVGGSYNKDNMISFEHRFNMTKIIADKLESVVLDIEDNTKFLGTYELLKKLKKIDNNLYFIMGADNVVNINTWINAEKLIKEFKFIVLTRNNIEINLSEIEYPENFEIVNIDFDISSSEFRENSNTNIIDQDVLKYIKNNNLYEV